MQAYIITATDQFCGYKDAFKVTAESAEDAIAKWTKLQGKLGINVEYRWPNPVACKAEHFKPQFVHQDNMPVICDTVAQKDKVAVTTITRQCSGVT